MNDHTKHLDENQEIQEIQVHMPPEVQRGVYANQLLVAHTQEEFVIDFILATPPAGIVNSRVMVSPAHAKRIAAALIENVAKYESVYGEITNIQVTDIPKNITAH
ncbi:MAG: DUF3467 domain-containing protein [Mariprofundaceae bacterium]